MLPCKKTILDADNNVVGYSKYLNETSGWKALAPNGKLIFDNENNLISRIEYQNESSGWKLAHKEESVKDANNNLISHSEYQNEASNSKSMSHMKKSFMGKEMLQIINQYSLETKKTFLSNKLSLAEKENVLTYLKNDLNKLSIDKQENLLKSGLNVDAIKKTINPKLQSLDERKNSLLKLNSLLIKTNKMNINLEQKI